jgi:hypothetical protein
MQTTHRRLSPATAEAADVRRRSIGAMIAHKQRCRQAGKPDDTTIDGMVARFLANGGAVTTCPTVYALPVQNGTGA